VGLTVEDPFGAARDPALPTLAPALDPTEVEHQFERRLPRLAGEHGLVRPRAIRVTRHKPGRRCVLEYDVAIERPERAPELATLIGKVRAHRSGKPAYRLLDALWQAGFRSDSPDGISVAEPIGHVPRFQMWLQRKVPGPTATELLAGPAGVALARRVAEAAHKIHRAGVPPKRSHSMGDELRILHACLPAVQAVEPRWAERIGRLLEACDRLGAATPELPARGIHRDFYADQVIVDGDRLYLIDFDLYCLGNPALDIGNFLGHITEQSLRTLGSPDALADVEQALEERFVELAGETARPVVRSYATLTLARHVYLSSCFLERRPFTEPILGLVEERLGVMVLPGGPLLATSARPQGVLEHHQRSEHDHQREGSPEDTHAGQPQQTADDRDRRR
jgi:hypothetical protein